MIERQKSLLAVLAPLTILNILTILSLAPAADAGNEPVKTPSKTTQAVQIPMMDRPEMASFKRVQVFAFKYRQKLSNEQKVLSQAKRIRIMTDDNYKKLQAELDRLNEGEPALARGGWNQVDIDAFDKQLANYKIEFDKANNKGTVHFSTPVTTSAPPATNSTVKTKATTNSKDASKSATPISPAKTAKTPKK